MSIHWHWGTTQPFVRQGKDPVRRNFSRDERSRVGILIREALQNPLDARRDDSDEPVRVTFRNLAPGTYDAGYLNSVITDEFRDRLLAAGGPKLPPVGDSYVCVIEDFGTKGLIGDARDYNADGSEQNWNAFWHREGEGSKGRASNGGAGQGKVTYFSHSDASAVFGLTVRADDRQRLMMGQASFLRDYPFHDGNKYLRVAYWTVSDSAPLPESSPDALEQFRRAFDLERDDKTPGLSLVIPYSKEFDHQEAVAAVILDFYMPIAAGKLNVSIGDTKIKSGTIDPIADRFVSDKYAIETGSSFTQSYRAFAKGVLINRATDVTLYTKWNKDRVISEESFPEGKLDDLRQRLEAGERVGVRFPLTLKLKSGEVFETSFDVFLEAPEGLDRNEEAFVRRDLLIGAESHVSAGSFVQKTRSLTWIQDRDLSDFLLTAEEPTHLKWNAAMARDVGTYVAPDVALRSIRQAVPRLLAVLLGGEAKKDVKSLARYFSRPAAESQRRGGGGGKTKNRNHVDPPAPPNIPRIRKPFRIEAVGTLIRVVPNGKSGPQDNEVPVRAELELAYEGLDQDPFSAYDPYDFDVAQAGAHPISLQGIELSKRSGNRIEFSVTKSDFQLEIGGFDPNVRLRARVNFDPIGTIADSVGEVADG